MNHWGVRVGLLGALGLLVPGCFALLLLAPKTTADHLPERPGKALYVRRCGTCHSLVSPESFAHRRQDVLVRYVDQKIITPGEQESLDAFIGSFGRIR